MLPFIRIGCDGHSVIAGSFCCFKCWQERISRCGNGVVPIGVRLHIGNICECVVVRWDSPVSGLYGIYVDRQWFSVCVGVSACFVIFVYRVCFVEITAFMSIVLFETI